MTEEQIIESFAKAMKEKIALRKNRYQPLGWMTMDFKRLVQLMKFEIAELEEEGSDRGHEAVDIANYAMFIWHLSHGEHN